MPQFLVTLYDGTDAEAESCVDSGFPIFSISAHSGE